MSALYPCMCPYMSAALQMRAEKAEARLKAVEQQLAANSKNFAKEIAGLKMQIMKLSK